MKWSTALIEQQPITGRMIKEDGSAVNIVDLLSDSDSNSDIIAETAAAIYSCSNGTTLRTVPDTGLPILSLRAKTTGALIVPLEVAVFAGGNTYFEVMINATLTGASFASAGSSAGAEADVSATAITGGTRVASGFVVMSGGQSKMVGRDNLLGRLGLEFDNAVNVGDIITIVAMPFAGNVSCSASIQWRKVV